jgi:hypothetical protein
MNRWEHSIGTYLISTIGVSIYQHIRWQLAGAHASVPHRKINHGIHTDIEKIPLHSIVGTT